jgi:hypothetical protein
MAWPWRLRANLPMPCWQDPLLLVCHGLGCQTRALPPGGVEPVTLLCQKTQSERSCWHPTSRQVNRGFGVTRTDRSCRGCPLVHAPVMSTQRPSDARSRSRPTLTTPWLTAGSHLWPLAWSGVGVPRNQPSAVLVSSCALCGWSGAAVGPPALSKPAVSGLVRLEGPIHNAAPYLNGANAASARYVQVPTSGVGATWHG